MAGANCIYWVKIKRLPHFDAEFGEVVAGFGVAYEFGYGLVDGLGGLAGVAEILFQEGLQAFVAELFLLAVLGLVDAVGIDEEGAAVHVADFLAGKVEFGPQSDGRVGLHLHVFAVEQRGGYGLRCRIPCGRS